MPERRNLVSARVPSHFKRGLPGTVVLLKGSGHEVDLLPPSNVEVKNEWSQTSTPLVRAFMTTSTLFFPDRFLCERSVVLDVMDTLLIVYGTHRCNYHAQQAMHEVCTSNQ